jgi:hypothetical protein
MTMTIWLAYVNYPITTAVYLKHALQQAGHQVTTIGPRLPSEAIDLWGLQNMHLPLDALDIDTDFTPDMADILTHTPVAELPDLYLWVESVAGHKPQNLYQLPCPKACWLIDTHYHLSTALETARQFDYVFIAQLIDLEAFRAVHPRAYWLPLACAPEIHGCQQVAKQYDIGFVGSINPRRSAMLEHLANHFSVHQERSFWTDMTRTFSASKIVLNDASLDDLNMRFFEALASGSLLLSNPTNGSGQDILFQNGIDYACHHDHDLVDVVRHYLDDEVLREQVASRGMQKVLTAHTYRHRADDLLDIVTGKKKDTFSAQELKERSLSQVPHIHSIITTRNASQWPTWQMIHEWEDVLSTQLAVPFRPFDNSCTLPAPNYSDQCFDLMFLPLAGELGEYVRNPQLIPLVMDLWRDDFTEFIQQASHFRLVFVTNLQAYQELFTQLPNIRYLPFTLADQYRDCPILDKEIDIIQYGRRNPLLEQYMERLLTDHPDIHYVTTDKSDNGDSVLIHSNKQGILGESNSRKKFMNLLCRSRISLVSTVGMDGSRQTGGIDPISPRFLESMAAGCHLVGRIPDSPEFRESGLYQLCHHVDSYEQFKNITLKLISQSGNLQTNYRPLLTQRLTSSLVPVILTALSSLKNDAKPNTTTEVIMYFTNPRNDILNRLNTLKVLEAELPASTRFANYQTLADVIAFYREFHAVDCYDLFSTILTQQQQTSWILLFSALELAYKGYADAACTLAHRARSLDPADGTVDLFHADLLRKAGRRDEARACADRYSEQSPEFQLAQAVLDMCTIDETLLLQQEHYHVLHTAHTLLRPQRYVEIGISSGKSLSLTKRGTAAIGVDPMTAFPDQQFFHSPENSPKLFKLTSNNFFEQGLMENEWKLKPLDMAFIDGLHLFEQALLDFIHLEQRAHASSVIFIHDCLPVSIAGAERERNTMVWTGDVWKVIPCLAAIRPDLEITTFPARPSGIAMVRRLDPASRVLANQFKNLVKHFMDMQLPAAIDERFTLLKVSDERPEVALGKVVAQQGAFQE